MQRLVWSELDAAARRAALARPAQRRDPALLAQVRTIVDEVRECGWDALCEIARRLDGEPPELVPVAGPAMAARQSLSREQVEAIELAYRNVTRFHTGAVPPEHVVETMPGLVCRKVWRPLDRVGLYIPGGRTPLFSTLLMLAIPARAAGVGEIVVATPPRADGGLDPVVALAAQYCGIEAIWTVGGAQAIAALAFGAGELPAVAKICGPGNAWVAEAKAYVAGLLGGPAIDMPAGPSELLVLADDSADPAIVAADLLSQAEHDPQAQVLLVTTSALLADAVDRAVTEQVASLPRAGIARESLRQARSIIVASLDDGIDVANAYAPEHLSLALTDSAPLVERIRNAGAVFVGHQAAESFGDYLAGSSHVLPTDGAARAWSGISILSFLRAMTVQQLTPAAAGAIAAPAAALARLEGLEAHARAADARALPPGDSVAAETPVGVDRLARAEIVALPAFDIAANANGLFPPDAIKLDANENPFGSLVGGGLAADVNRYPEPQPAALRAAMAALYGVAPDQLVVTRGADDAIDIILRTFCRPRDAVAICPPTFSAYAHFAALAGARLVEAPLDEAFDFTADRFLAAVAPAAPKVAFLCSPNNPTGSVIAAADVIRVCDALPDTIIVLDEAYVEFSDQPSLALEAAARPNLIVLRTLSKAYGIAGARIGAAIGTAGTIALIARALPPYPLPSLSIGAALATLSPSRRPLHAERIARIKAERARMAAALARSPIVHSVRSGGGNFLFLEVAEPPALAERLRRLGIRVRFRPNAAPGGLRLTIGTEAENDAALAAFEIGEASANGRRADVVRDTKETRIAVSIDLDRDGPRRIDTGLPFFDHMLDQVAAHAGIALTLACEGDHEIDSHHSLEDCALALGSALGQALDDRRGIGRFGFSLPMDETEAHVLIDLSGRPFSRFEGTFDASHIGAYPTEMTPHIFRSLADSLRAAIHVRVQGENDHHKVEACFKAFGRALRQAVRREGDALPSTKGVL